MNIRGIAKYYDDPECQLPFPPNYCRNCALEFQFTGSEWDANKRRLEMKVVTWRDFRSGETPFEEIWDGHRFWGGSHPKY